MVPSAIYYLHEIGLKKNQEDYIWPIAGTASADNHIFIVCDGVGGSNNGEIASRIVSESVGNSLLKIPVAKINLAVINQFLNEAKVKLINYAVAHNLSTDMATTFTLLVLTDKKAFVCWCGDSRVYHVQKGEISFKTQDHSLVNTLVKTGDITADEAEDHPQKNVILKAIRADETMTEAEGHWIRKIENDDYFLLCTDGLLENIGDRDIKFLLEQNDKGTIDLVQSFQKFCYGKTNDNYSMYLVKLAKGKSRFGRSTIWLLIVLLLSFLTFGALIFRSRYLSAHKGQVIMPVNRPKSAFDRSDTNYNHPLASTDSVSPKKDSAIKTEIK